MSEQFDNNDTTETEDTIIETEENENPLLLEDDADRTVVPTSNDDKINIKESFATGFFTGMLTLATVVLMALVILLLVFGKRVGFVNINSSKYDNPTALESVDNDMEKITNKISYLAALINTFYLNKVDEEQIIEGIFKGIMESTGDKYTVYFTKEECDDLLLSTSGQYEGIGCYVELTDDGEILISEIIEDSGSDKAGLKVGDIITAVDSKSVKGMKLSEITNLIRNESGENIDITVIRKNSGKEETITVTKTSQDYLSVVSEMLDDNIGYVAISGFENNTPEQFDKAVDELINKGADSFIIDIRSNPGGTLESVSGIANRILPKGLVVYTKDKNGKEVDRVESTDDEYIDKPFVLLVNGSSASASEVLAGAIKDRKAGKLVGTTTFGKGIVQSLIQLADGSAVKITTAKYYTPNGNYIHEKGITPDYEVELDTEKYYDGTDTQLDKAIEVIKEMKGN